MYISIRKLSVSLPGIDIRLKLTFTLRGAWFSDPLNEYLSGRRPAIFVAGIFSFFPAIGAGASRTWVQLLVCRILLGVGLGCKAAVGKYCLSWGRYVQMLIIIVSVSASLCC
jgi:MFS family permease